MSTKLLVYEDVPTRFIDDSEKQEIAYIFIHRRMSKQTVVYCWNKRFLTDKRNKPLMDATETKTLKNIVE